jgi:hypothetical protein
MPAGRARLEPDHLATAGTPESTPERWESSRGHGPYSSVAEKRRALYFATIVVSFLTAPGAALEYFLGLSTI